MPIHQGFCNFIRCGLCASAILLSSASAGAQSRDLPDTPIAKTLTATREPEDLRITIEIRSKILADFDQTLRSAINIEVPRFNPETAFRNPTPFQFSCLTKLTYGVAFADSLKLSSFSPFNSGNATRISLATGANLLGRRLAKSERFHRYWFVPQLASIGVSAVGLRDVGTAPDADDSFPSRIHGFNDRSRSRR
jgi:hypothetical protein